MTQRFPTKPNCISCIKKRGNLFWKHKNSGSTFFKVKALKSSWRVHILLGFFLSMLICSLFLSTSGIIQGASRSLLKTVRHTVNCLCFFFCFFPFIFISWRLITLQYCSGFCHTVTWISHGFTCIPHPDPPSHLPLHPIPLGLPSAPGLSTCLMYPTWAGDLFHPRQYTCFDAVLSKHPTLAFSHRIQKSTVNCFIVATSMTLNTKEKLSTYLFSWIWIILFPIFK